MHSKDKETMIIELYVVSLIFIKKIGIVHKNNPIVVIPNARPGFLGSTETNKAKDIAIVIEKKETPIIESHMLVSPKRRKGIELVFDLMFWFIVIDALFEIVNLLSGKGDVVRLVVALVLVGVMFAGARLAHNGNMVAGVVGIIVGGVVCVYFHNRYKRTEQSEEDPT